MTVGNRSSTCLIFISSVLGIFHLASTNTTYDPYRWILSYGKPTHQSSTEGSHVASFATDGDLNNYDLPINYSKTTISDNPYLQVDLGEKFYISVIVLVFPVLNLNSPATYTNLRVTVGSDASVDSTTNWVIWNDRNGQKHNRLDVKKPGRYVTVQRMGANTELSLCEVAVYKVPVENLAFRRKVNATSSKYGSGQHKATDMALTREYCSNKAKNPWLRVDLLDIVLVHEVLIFARFDCCVEKRLHDFDIRIGNSLEKNGNSNPLCAHSSLYTAEIRSFYCDLFGRFVNVLRHIERGSIEISEVIVNPENTANLARGVQTQGNVEYASGHGTWAAVDGDIAKTFESKNIIKEKQVTIMLAANYTITMVYIVGSIHDFSIRVLGSGKSSECIPGLQNTIGRISTAFFCEPRITGDTVHLKQHDPEKTLKIGEIAVFEETKPAIVDTDKYVWAMENDDFTLNCKIKGYPVPVASWVKDKQVLKSGSSTLQLRTVTSNYSGVYECWANNKHVVDARQYELKFTSGLRVCVDHLELKYNIAELSIVNYELKGTHWYRIDDQIGKQFLQFRESLPPKHVSSCEVWLNGKHPEVQDNVVSRVLCVKNATSDCSTMIGVYMRRCATHYVYNFKTLESTAALKFCFKNTPRNINKGNNPTVASPIKNHALFEKVLQTEHDVAEPYQCLTMCHLDKKCKSFNYSKKLKICELNGATKKAFPGNYGFRADYDHYHLGSGMVVSVKREL